MPLKIHKQGIPGRPIGNGIGSATEKISANVDEHLKKSIPRIPSNIKRLPISGILSSK